MPDKRQCFHLQGMPASYLLSKIRNLGKIGARTNAVVPALVAALSAKDIYVRQTAAEALGEIGPAARDAIPALVAALASSSPSGYNLSGRASDALVRIGADAVPALIEFVKSPGNRWFIREGIWTLGKIGPAAKEAVPVIAPYLGSDNSQIGYAAAEALGNIGPAAGAAVPALRLALNDKDSLLRLEAAAALKKIEGR